MTGRKTQLALEIDRDRVCAVHAKVERNRVRVEGWCCADRPQSMDPADASAIGKWVASELDGRSMPKSGVAVAVQRGEVVLKRLNLPFEPNGRRDELVSMVRLQISRQIPVPMEGTAVDFVELPQSVSPTAPGVDGNVVRVLAGALPGDRLGWIRDAAKRGGLGLSRIGLRSSGAAAVFAETSIAHDGPILGVAPGTSTTECVVVESGRLLFARAVDLALPTETSELSAYVEQIAVEAKRTWMAYRANSDSSEVHAVSVLGSGAFAHDIGRACASELEMPYERLRLSASIEFPAEMSDWDRCVSLPLVGLMAESVFTEPTLDFAHPRVAPDRAAAVRQRALVGLFAAVVVFGSIGVFGWLHLQDLEGEAEAAGDALSKAQMRHARYLVESARLDNLEQWASAEVDWIGHLAMLSETVGNPREVRFDGLSAALANEVVFQLPRSVTDISKGKWLSDRAISFSLGGPAINREIANTFREELLDSGIYRVETRGADVPNSFRLDLTTTYLSPLDANVNTPKDGEEPDGADDPRQAGDAGGGS
jgi:Tfp pilus assembly PilM family ATPase